MTSRRIELTWQPPSNADSLGSDLLGYRVYVEELCDHLMTVGMDLHEATSRKMRRGHFEAAAADEEVVGEEGLKRRGRSQCRTIPPETVHGATTTLANFENLGNLIL